VWNVHFSCPIYRFHLLKEIIIREGESREREREKEREGEKEEGRENCENTKW
jgi:hypothetical protein